MDDCLTNENLPKSSLKWAENVTVGLLVPLTSRYMKSFSVTVSHRTTLFLPMAKLSVDVLM